MELERSEPNFVLPIPFGCNWCSLYVACATNGVINCICVVHDAMMHPNLSCYCFYGREMKQYKLLDGEIVYEIHNRTERRESGNLSWKVHKMTSFTLQFLSQNTMQFERHGRTSNENRWSASSGFLLHAAHFRCLGKGQLIELKHIPFGTWFERFFLV